jgi:hypothetical protein
VWCEWFVEVSEWGGALMHPDSLHFLEGLYDEEEWGRPVSSEERQRLISLASWACGECVDLDRGDLSLLFLTLKDVLWRDS